MGRLYEAAKRIDDIIERKGLDKFRIRGAISLKTGFVVGLIAEDEPDDPQKLSALRQAAEEVLGESLAV